jgi:hypothetical protein
MNVDGFLPRYMMFTHNGRGLERLTFTGYAGSAAA